MSSRWARTMSHLTLAPCTTLGISAVYQAVHRAVAQQRLRQVLCPLPQAQIPVARFVNLRHFVVWQGLSQLTDVSHVMGWWRMRQVLTKLAVLVKPQKIVLICSTCYQVMTAKTQHPPTKMCRILSLVWPANAKPMPAMINRFKGYASVSQPSILLMA